MSNEARRAKILKRAREMAQSGNYRMWLDIEVELRTHSEPYAQTVLADPKVRSELDQLCFAAKRKRGEDRA